MNMNDGHNLLRIVSNDGLWYYRFGFCCQRISFLYINNGNFDPESNLSQSSLFFFFMRHVCFI
jgi:hypothetical protein